MNKEISKTEEKSGVPSHIVLLPDGNRRWATEKGLPSIDGHLEGFKNLRRFFLNCQKRGIKVLTAFGFSVENWKRPKEEVKYLLKLLEQGFSEEIEAYNKKREDSLLFSCKAKLNIIGQRERLPQKLQEVIKRIEDLTKNNRDNVLNLAVSYSGRWDVLQAVREIIKDKLSPEEITEKLFNNYLSTENLPLPDLIIRTGGEKRLSNFLLWQAAYSELYFSDKYWPDFNEKDLDKVLDEYNSRKRRFGR